MAEYEKARGGKLKLKGGETLGLSKKRKKKAKKPHSHSDGGEGEAATSGNLQRDKEKDTDAHGGWWSVESVSEVSGSIAIEVGPGKRTYVRALDNGLFTLGAPHDEGDGPAPEEILTAFHIDENKVAFKSGYDKYLRVDKDGTVVGRSDAVGHLEQWEPVFQNGELALSSANGKFLSVDEELEEVVANSEKVGEGERICIRRQGPRDVVGGTKKREEAGEEEAEGGSLEHLEVNYVRKFQKFQDKKLRICPADSQGLSKAKEDGNLHELMLDRRAKMKADRYCK